MSDKSNLGITKFCESISLDDKVPFWDYYKENCDNLHNLSRNSLIDNCKNYKIIHAIIYKEKQADYHEKVKELKTHCYKVYFTKTLGITDIQQAQEYAANNTAI